LFAFSHTSVKMWCLLGDNSNPQLLFVRICTSKMMPLYCLLGVNVAIKMWQEY
jgi:hypothetical protein